MRVVYVIDSLAPGGAERSLVELVPALVARGVELAVVTRKPGGALAPAARAAGAGVIELGTSGRRQTVAALGALLGQHRPDVVHTATVDASVVGRVAAARHQLPLLTTLTGTPYGADHHAGSGPGAVRVRAAQALDAATAQLVWRFHAPAEHVADVMARRLLVPRDRITVIPRGRDLAALGERTASRRVAARRDLGVSEQAPLVVALARHEPVKGLDVLVDAVHRLTTERPDLVVVVAGRTGAATSALERQIASGPAGAVRLVGHRHDVGEVLAAADAVAVPSRREGLPGVVIEAMALGVPVVASDLPGCREVLGDGVGLRVPVGDPAALAAALVTVLDDPSRAGDLGAGRRRAASRFGLDAVAASTVALWVRTVADGPPHRLTGAGRRPR